MLLRKFWYLVYFVFIIPIFSVETFLVPDNFTKEKLGKYIEVFEDKKSELKLEDLISNEEKFPFVHISDETPNLGFSDSTFWVRLKILGHTNQYKEYFIHISNHALENLDFYECSLKNFCSHIQTGQKFSSVKKSIFHRDFVFSTMLSKNEEKIFYIKVKTQSSIAIPIYLYETSNYYRSTIIEETFYGIYYGSMLALLLYNLFIFLSLRDSSYLTYVFYITSYIILQAAGSGHLGLYFFYDNPLVKKYALNFMIGLTVFFAVLFTKRFLKTHIYARTLNKILNLIMVLGILVCFYTLFIQKYRTHQISLILAIITGATILLTGIITFYRKYRPARYFLIAWGLFIVSIFITIFRILGFYPANTFNIYAVQIGSLVEALLLSFALADRINIIKKENQEAITRTILYQEQANAELEKKVELRTQEVKKYLDSIHKDLETAKSIQLNMLPKVPNKTSKFHILPEYIPLEEVGGDFYDIYFIDENRLRCFIADATGHGVQAALVTMSIKSEYDSIKNSITNPGLLLAELHSRFLDLYKNTNVYFTSAIIDIDLNTKILTHASAGHPTQYLLRDGKIIGLGKTGHIIGMIKGKSFDTIETELESGDTILLFTDGLYEEFNMEHEQFGDERLKKLVEANSKLDLNELIFSLLANLQNYLGDKKRQDDITVIGIKISI
ncbi:MAG: 7TM diverse intracellular signaling domain-containing protein [Leptospiraceae bacterium]|nr:7TM diverse intracellular signaling domain-containing protein [Leptospiraceae bacterium]